MADPYLFRVDFSLEGNQTAMACTVDFHLDNLHFDPIAFTQATETLVHSSNRNSRSRREGTAIDFKGVSALQPAISVMRRSQRLQ
jgi:hypothetical protein